VRDRVDLVVIDPCNLVYGVGYERDLRKALRVKTLRSRLEHDRDGIRTPNSRSSVVRLDERMVLRKQVVQAHRHGQVCGAHAKRPVRAEMTSATGGAVQQTFASPYSASAPPDTPHHQAGIVSAAFKSHANACARTRAQPYLLSLRRTGSLRVQNFERSADAAVPGLAASSVFMMSPKPPTATRSCRRRSAPAQPVVDLAAQFPLAKAFRRRHDDLAG